MNVFAVGPEFDQAFKFTVALGTFLPPDELDRARPVAVLGAKGPSELYGDGRTRSASGSASAASATASSA